MDAQDGLPLGDEEAGEVLGEVAALALVGEEVGVAVHGVLNDLGKFDDAWHEQMLHNPFAPGEIEAKPTPSSPFLHGQS